MTRAKSSLRALGVLLAGAALGCDRRPECLFEEASLESGEKFRVVGGPSGERLVVETMTGGLAWIDYDQDGDYDLFCPNAHGNPLHADAPGDEEDRLYRNNGRGGMEDVTRAAGVGDRRYGMGAAVGDYDNDGDSDLLVTNYGRNTLYRNGGDGAFQDVTESAGLVETGFNTSAAWFDLDRDGDLDLYVARYLSYDVHTSRRCTEEGVPVSCHPTLFPGEPDLLYENLDGRSFREIGGRAGIRPAGEPPGKGLGVAVLDFDEDGWTDVFVANDTTPNFLWRNRSGRELEDVAQAAGVALSSEGRALAGMGVDVADVNGDGRLDIYVTNFTKELNSLFLGRPGGQFIESSRAANLGETLLPLGFGTLLVDADMDGDADIVTANGHLGEVVGGEDETQGRLYAQKPDYFQNSGKGVFEKAAAFAGPAFAERFVGRALASADFDGDLDLDLALLTLDRGIVFLRNTNPLGHRAVVLKLVGRKSPRDAPGARVEATVEGRKQVYVAGSARSYLSACDPRVFIGLGTAKAAAKIVVTWPSGAKSELANVPAGQLVLQERDTEESDAEVRKRGDRMSSPR